MLMSITENIFFAFFFLFFFFPLYTLYPVFFTVSSNQYGLFQCSDWSCKPLEKNSVGDKEKSCNIYWKRREIQVIKFQDEISVWKFCMMRCLDSLPSGMLSVNASQNMTEMQVAF